MSKNNKRRDHNDETPENVVQKLYNEEALEDEETQEAEVETEEQVDEPTAEADEVITTLKNEAEKNLQGWQRTLAEFQNYKRRVERERDDMRERVALDTLVRFLPIIDDFERALDSVPESLDGDPWLNGITLIMSKFQKLLDDHDVTVIDPVGEEFDPNCHEAVGSDDDSDMESGHVTTTLQKGYASGERVLRPAMVRVAS